ncbi:unnamed protein product [Ambrosiozyma monospora]|uniref:Unnamed protein product n=1 Tax=Ambrosiozyma monospora TaxID=43982 RepID=A0ACB5TMZ2_AMBMO|nr:unnamed protein product [Ambrosiozyma monospora]
MVLKRVKSFCWILVNPFEHDVPIECFKTKPVATKDALIHLIYNETFTDESYINNSILCPTNEEVDSINTQLLNQLDGPVQYSQNEDIINEFQRYKEKATLFEVKNTAERYHGSTFPPNKLALKIGMSLMLIRNMMPKLGLVNGTRLV